MSIRIVIADDHDVVRQGLRTILRARPEWEVVAEAGNGKEAVEAVRSIDPDILILDITMPVMTGLDAMHELSGLNVRTRVLIFTMHDSSSLVRAVKDAGAQGYVLKSNAARDLIRAIDALLSGGTFYGSNSETESRQNEVRDKGLKLFGVFQCIAAAYPR
jgi:DNA-binding NarL/FixJ family response regulator